MRLFYLIIFYTTIIYAHPHTYIDVYINIHSKSNHISKLDFSWKIDEMTSAMLIMDFDKDGDGKINKEENDSIYKNYFKDLKEFSYYTYIKIKNKQITLPNIENFYTTIEKGKIIYNFSLSIDVNKNDLKIDMYDEDFFIAMMLKKEFVQSKDLKFKVNDLDRDFYFGYELEFK